MSEKGSHGSGRHDSEKRRRKDKDRRPSARSASGTQDSEEETGSESASTRELEVHAHRGRSASLNAASVTGPRILVDGGPSALHKFQPKGSGRPVTCKVCNKFIWGSAGYACGGCKLTVHSKTCAAKARDMPCPKALKSSVLGPDDQERLAQFQEGELLRISLPEQQQRAVVLNPHLILADLLHEVALLQGVTNYVPYDAEGKLMHDAEIPLSKLRVPHVFYVPKGMPLAMVPGLLGFGQAIQRLNVKSEERARSRTGSMSARRSVKKIGKEVRKSDSNERRGVLHMQLRTARNLAVSDDWEYVYCIVSVPTTQHHFRSIPVPFSSAPEWNQPFKAPLHVDDAEIHVKIWTTSRNQRSADTVIGQLTIEVRDFEHGDSHNKLYTLKKEPKKLKVDRSKLGQLRFKWKYLERQFKAAPVQDGHESSEEEDVPGEEPTEEPAEGAEEVPVSAPSPRRRKKRRLRDEYDVGDEIGRGAYSVVKRVTHKESGVLYACKILDNYSNMENAEEEEETFKRETSILRRLKHAHIVQIVDVFKDREHYYVVLENVAGGELFDQLMERGFYSEADCAPLIRQVLGALAYLHGDGFAHRDIKPENLLFTDDKHDTLKIVDFGEAKTTRKGPLSDYVGTPDYMAPEVLRGLPYGSLVDCWAVGVITYIMLCGFPPFEGDSEAELFINVMNMRYDFPSPEWDEVSDEAKAFVRALLCGQDARLSAADALQHEWLQRHAPN